MPVDDQQSLGSSALLTAGVSSGATTLPLTAAIGVADGRTMRVVCEGEVMLVTAGMGTTSLTVTRGQEGTTAAAHPSGATVQQRLTPAGLANTRTQPNSHAHNGTDGSGTVAHSATTGRTANDHHAQAHSLTGTDHTLSGLTTGHVLTATSPTAAAFQAPSGGGGSMSSFTLAGDGGTPQTITDTNTLTVAGGSGLASTAGATDTVTLDLDISSLTADASPDGAADYVATWDASASAHKKVLLDDLPGGGGSGFSNPMTDGGDLIVGAFIDAYSYLGQDTSGWSQAGGGDGNTYEFAREFSCSQAKLVSGFGWYRQSGDGTPTAFHLFDTTTSTSVLTVTTGIPSTGTGWLWFDCSGSGVHLVAGRHYRVSRTRAPSTLWEERTSAPTTDSGITDYGGYLGTGAGVYPTGSDSRWFGVSIRLGSGVTGSSGTPIRKALGATGSTLTVDGNLSDGMSWLPAGQVLTDGATITWDVPAGHHAQVTLGGNRTLAAPTNLIAGQVYTLHVVQDGTGSRTLTWNSVFKWPGGTAPTLSTGAGKRDVFVFSTDGTNLYAVAQALDVR
jgi:hypothetical protein